MTAGSLSRYVRSNVPRLEQAGTLAGREVAMHLWADSTVISKFSVTEGELQDVPKCLCA